jgi:hypothetical protein
MRPAANAAGRRRYGVSVLFGLTEAAGMSREQATAQCKTEVFLGKQSPCGMLTPERGRWRPLRSPIPLRGSLGQRFAAPPTQQWGCDRRRLQDADGMAFRYSNGLSEAAWQSL